METILCCITVMYVILECNVCLEEENCAHEANVLKHFMPIIFLSTMNLPLELSNISSF